MSIQSISNLIIPVPSPIISPALAPAATYSAFAEHSLALGGVASLPQRRVLPGATVSNTRQLAAGGLVPNQWTGVNLQVSEHAFSHYSSQRSENKFSEFLTTLMREGLPYAAALQKLLRFLNNNPLANFSENDLINNFEYALAIYAHDTFVSEELAGVQDQMQGLGLYVGAEGFADRTLRAKLKVAQIKEERNRITSDSELAFIAEQEAPIVATPQQDSLQPENKVYPVYELKSNHGKPYLEQRNFKDLEQANIAQLIIDVANFRMLDVPADRGTLTRLSQVIFAEIGIHSASYIEVLNFLLTFHDYIDFLDKQTRRELAFRHLAASMHYAVKRMRPNFERQLANPGLIPEQKDELLTWSLNLESFDTQLGKMRLPTKTDQQKMHDFVSQLIEGYESASHQVKRILEKTQSYVTTVRAPAHVRDWPHLPLKGHTHPSLDLPVFDLEGNPVLIKDENGRRPFRLISAPHAASSADLKLAAINDQTSGKNLKVKSEFIHFNAATGKPTTVAYHNFSVPDYGFFGAMHYKDQSLGEPFVAILLADYADTFARKMQKVYDDPDPISALEQLKNDKTLPVAFVSTEDYRAFRLDPASFVKSL